MLPYEPKAEKRAGPTTPTNTAEISTPKRKRLESQSDEATTPTADALTREDAPHKGIERGSQQERVELVAAEVNLCKISLRAPANITCRS